MQTDTDNTTALILSGQGYELTIATEAAEQKKELLTLATTVVQVSDNDESFAAQRVSRSLAQMRIAVEKCRKEVKEPVNRIGKMIDQAAKDFVADIEAEEKRITKLVGDHAAEVARIKREKEAEERRLMDEARAKREAEEAAAAKAQSTGKISDIIAAKRAEEERKAAADERMEASNEVAATKVADGVRFAWDFEVENADTVYRTARAFVEIEVKRSPVLAWLKSLEDADDDPVAAAAACGIRAFKKAVVSSR